MRVLWLIWIYIINSYVLDGRLIKCQAVYVQAQVKSQVCEISIGRIEINSPSYCKWDALHHCYDRRIMGNEFHVILMILLSWSIMWSRMKKLNCVKFSPSHSLPLFLTLTQLLTLGLAVKELTADTTFSLSFISCQPLNSLFLPPSSSSSCFLGPVMSAKVRIK